MHTSQMLGAGVLVAALGWFLVPSTGPGGLATTQTPAPPAVANGHYALVVTGDRGELTISHAVRKADPWAGVAKGAESPWTLSIRGANGAQLAAIPLDVVHFDLAPERQGGGIVVEGCSVRDPRITMLCNVPAFAEATSYVFTRRDKDAVALLGMVTAARVAELAGGGR